MSKIQWTDETWNPITGCSEISPGCLNCYAREAANSARLQQFKQYQDVKDWDGTTFFAEDQIEKPLKWRSPKKIFVCSMSDLFHINNPAVWIDRVFAIMAICQQHTFQVLTKRPARMLEYLQNPKTTERIEEAGYEFTHNMDCLNNWPLPNVWVGTSVENQKVADDRIPLLLQTPAKIRFLSCEPLLSSLKLEEYLSGIDYAPDGYGHQSTSSPVDWVIVGGESGSKARPCHINWIKSIVNQCKEVEVPVFAKQLGSGAIATSSEATDAYYQLKFKDRKGGNPEEWPQQFPREFPKILEK